MLALYICKASNYVTISAVWLSFVGLFNTYFYMCMYMYVKTLCIHKVRFFGRSIYFFLIFTILFLFQEPVVKNYLNSKKLLVLHHWLIDFICFIFTCTCMLSMSLIIRIFTVIYRSFQMFLPWTPLGLPKWIV